MREEDGKNSRRRWPAFRDSGELEERIECVVKNKTAHCPDSYRNLDL